MRKNNGYMIPKVKRKTADSYVCSGCGKTLSPRDAFFYVDSCNCAITDNSKPFCRECYRIKYGE